MLSTPPPLSGKTKLFLVIGDPIAQVKSPDRFTSAAHACGADAVFVPYSFGVDDFDVAINGLRALKNLAGLVVTIPFKIPILEAVDHLTERARKTGAVNVVKVSDDGTWTGDTLDGAGFVSGLHSNGVSIQGKQVQLVGAGGAGASVAVAVANAGAREISVLDLDTAKSRGLVEKLNQTNSRAVFSTGDKTASADIVINASPAGMRAEDPTPVDVEQLRSGQVIADLIMEPKTTELLRAAEARACRTVPGQATLTGQVDEAMKFFGLTPV